MSYIIAFEKNTVALYENKRLIEYKTINISNNEKIDSLCAIMHGCYLALKNNSLIFSMIGWKEKYCDYIQKLFGKSFNFKFSHAHENRQFWLDSAIKAIDNNLKETILSSQNTNIKSLIDKIEKEIIFLFAGIKKIFIENKNAININVLTNPVNIKVYDIEQSLISQLSSYNLFTDASVRPQDKKVTIACTVVDINNNILAMSRSMLDYNIFYDSNNAEIYSVAKGLELVKTMGIEEISIFTDSSCAIDKIKSYSPYCLKQFKESIETVINNAMHFKNCSLTHIPRELNTLTDNLTHF